MSLVTVEILVSLRIKEELMKNQVLTGEYKRLY